MLVNDVAEKTPDTRDTERPLQRPREITAQRIDLDQTLDIRPQREGDDRRGLLHVEGDDNRESSGESGSRSR